MTKLNGWDRQIAQMVISELDANHITLKEAKKAIAGFPVVIREEQNNNLSKTYAKPLTILNTSLVDK